MKDEVERIVAFFVNLFKYCVGDSSEVISEWDKDDDESAMMSSRKHSSR